MWWCDEPFGALPAGHVSIAERLRDCELDAFLTRSARPVAPDEMGRFFLDADAQIGTLVACAPGLFGTLEVMNPGARALHVVLEPDHALRVRVVDTRGAPVTGVRVALRQFYNGEHYHDHGRATTNADGVAHLPHYRALIAEDWDFTAQYALSIAEPVSPTVNHFFEVVDPPNTSVELVLPPCGSIELKLPPGGEFLEVGLEALGFGPAAERDWPSFADGWRRPEKDVLLFPFVGLGLEFVPVTRSSWLTSPHADSRLRGPSAVGERIVAQLSEQTGRLRVRGRVVHTDGAALGAQQVRVQFSGRPADEDDEVALGAANTRSDANGEFRLEIPHRGALELSVEVQTRTSDFIVFGTARRANIARHGAELDLGDVRIERWDVIASGSVVDAFGNPVPDAEVQAYEASEHRDRSGALQVRWDPLLHARSQSNTGGVFELRAPRSPRRLALVAGAESAVSARLECRGGAAGVQLVLAPTGRLVGRIATTADTRLEYLEVRVSCVDPLQPATTEDLNFSRSVDTHGEFALRSLPEGRYVVEVHRQGFDQALATVENIQVRAETPTDPRLTPLVLKERPELFEVRLVDARDRPVSDATLARVMPTPDGPRVEEVGYTSSRMLVDRGTPPLWIIAEGFAALEFDPATVGDTLRLTRAPLLRVEFAPGCELPREGVTTWIQVRPLDRARDLVGWIDARLSPAQHGAQTQVGFLGRIELEVWIEADNSVRLPVEVAGGGSLVDTSLPQTTTLKFEPEALAHALAEAGRRQ